ncbi:MAG: phytoene/squalene synthase family protein [Candidatus Omnitrophica bacterium]|nr:phytoene/squalene synthase family protein [Candidatus Omnitrophota bacterium]MBU1869112.1 phytoene/squalene synthase family protein [Candidatus Omnitrophota bacterium]
MDKLADGYLKAKAITKKHAKTFYFASLFLPKEKRLAAYAVYAICRISDDSIDNNPEAAARANLPKIKDRISTAYGNGELQENILLVFRETVRKYGIPKSYFDELIEGIELDLNKKRYKSFEELYDYCYKVAGVVGLMMLKIFGYDDLNAESYAVNLGIAMQLTNISRDIKEDYLRGRIYLPEGELKEFGVSEKDLADSKLSEGFKELLKLQIKRARDYYSNSKLGTRLINDEKCRFVVYAMNEIYSGILDAIEKNGYDVFSRRAHVNGLGKLIRAAKLLTKGGHG